MSHDFLNSVSSLCLLRPDAGVGAETFEWSPTEPAWESSFHGRPGPVLEWRLLGLSVLRS